MNFPVWDMPVIGGGLLIGLVAIVHVLVAHYAIGGGLFLVWSEARAYRHHDEALLEFVRRHSTYFLLTVLVVGASTGVGIWWTIGIVHPTATSSLIHTFVGLWAIEWVLFFVEIAAALVYYYGWDRLDRRTHLLVGWIYFGAAWLSLFVINGILTFMLTPGSWLETRRVGDAFFNPTMVPSLVVRTASATALAGLYALLTAVTIGEDRIRDRIVRYAATWVLAGASILPIGGVWYITRIPPLAREISMGGVPAVTIFAALSIMLSALIVVVTYLGPYRRPQFANVLLVGMLAFLGAGVTGVTEWVREAVRKPYIIYSYMYSNAIRLEDADAIRAKGVLRSARWVSVREPTAANERRAGYELFRTQCRSCHTIDGYNAIRPMVKGWRDDFIDYQLQHLNELKGYMPPFIGTDAERRALSRWLGDVSRGAPFSNPVEPISGRPAIGERGREDTATSRVVPDPDPLGLPAPVWLLKSFLVATFILHLLPMNLALGGGLMTAWAAWRARAGAGRRQAEAERGYVALSTGLAKLLPVATALSITLGVAPLLFVQALYGPVFYTASVLMAWPWLSVIGLLVAGYGGYYGLAWLQQREDRRPVLLAWVSASGFLLIGFIFTNNMTLMLRPEIFGTLYAASEHGLHWNLDDVTLWPRYLHFVVASLALTGIAVTWLARAKTRRAPALGAWLKRVGSRLFIGATLVQLPVGLWFLASQPSRVKDMFLGGSLRETGLLVASVVLALVAAAIIRRSIPIATSAIGLSVVGMAIIRHRVRTITLTPHFSVDTVQVVPQTGVFVMFLILLLVGLALVGWMISRLAAAPSSRTEHSASR